MSPKRRTRPRICNKPTSPAPARGGGVGEGAAVCKTALPAALLSCKCRPIGNSPHPDPPPQAGEGTNGRGRLKNKKHIPYPVGCVAQATHAFPAANVCRAATAPTLTRRREREQTAEAV
ncbi:hypothetical protein [Kingella potus]|uniref:hypothetical protein n=1 Tax=Kingella potus TaxID=265175 RepID=UPI001FD22441|nr:hypothetical protein [Kingella potus]UOP00218.1 hypothetical protein LVJ84_09815 [Kingella potus]